MHTKNCTITSSSRQGSDGRSPHYYSAISSSAQDLFSFWLKSYSATNLSFSSCFSLPVVSSARKNYCIAAIYLHRPLPYAVIRYCLYLSLSSLMRIYCLLISQLAWWAIAAQKPDPYRRRPPSSSCYRYRRRAEHHYWVWICCSAASAHANGTDWRSSSQTCARPCSNHSHRSPSARDCYSQKAMSC